MTQEPRRAVAFGASLVTLVLVEVARVWAPSLLRSGPDGSTLALLAAAGAVLCLAIPLPLALRLRTLGAVRLWTLGGTALVLGRGALIVTDGGLPQLVAASVGVLGAAVALTGLAGAVGGGLARVARIGVLLGVVAATGLHVATRTAGLIWPGTLLTRSLSVALVLVLAAAIAITARALPDESVDTGPAWPWASLAPLLLLTGLVTGVPGRLAVATGWNSSSVAVTVALGQAGALLAALLAARIGAVRAGGSGAGLVLVGTASALQSVGWQGVLGPSAVAVGLGLIVGSATAPIPSRGHGPTRRAVTCAAALFGFALVAALYYLGLEVRLRVLDDVWLLLIAMVAAGLGFTAALSGRSRTVRSTVDAWAVTRLLAVLAVLVTAVGVLAIGPQRAALLHPEDELRVATYNVRSGFDLDGRFDPWSQAALLRAHAPDVVLLNEVDRGWLVTGGHDALEQLGAELGLPHVRFGAAADEVFGNAMLSRFPVSELAIEQLPRGEDLMRRSSLAAVLDLSDDRSLGIVGTQLSQEEDPARSRLPQSRAVAATVARLRERQVPTVLLGDLGGAAEGPELASFAQLVSPVLAEGTATFPADEPVTLRSQVLASEDLRSQEVLVPAGTASSHRPVVVTFQLEDDGPA